MHYYPENLRSQAVIWAWKIRDLCVAAALVILGALAMAGTGFSLLLIIGIAYAVLTVQAEDVTVVDFVIYACRFFFAEQQEFEWRLTRDETKGQEPVNGGTDRDFGDA